jgi:hypothetical protein
MFVWSLIGVGLLAFMLPAQLRPEIYPSDDALFYPQVAWHIVQGHGSTFNEITYTNGYHPLWMLVCVPLAFLAQMDKGMLLQLVIVMAQLLGLTSLYLFYRLGLRLGLRYLPALLPLLAAFLFSIGMYGSEAHLTVLMLLVTLHLFVRRDGSSRSQLLLSLAVGFLFLSRLDTIFLIACILLVVLMDDTRSKRESFVRNALMLGLPFSLIAGVYLLYNYLTFGHLMPISGALKSAVPAYTHGLDYVLARFHRGLGPVGLPVAIAAIVGLLLMLVIDAPKRVKSMIRVLSVGVLLHAAHVVIVTDHLTHWTWYYLPGVINMCLIAAVMMEWMEARVFRSARKVYVGLVVLVAAVIGFFGIMRGWSEYFNPETKGLVPMFATKSSEKWQIEMAHYIDSQMSPRAALLTFDWPGYIAYHSDLRVVPTDGLMNDYAWQDEIRGGMKPFVDKHEIRFFLGPEFWFPEPPIGMNNIIAADSSQRIDFYAPLSRDYIGSVQLDSRDSVGRMREVLRNPNVYYYDYRLWRLPSDSTKWISIPKSMRML